MKLRFSSRRSYLYLYSVSSTLLSSSSLHCPFPISSCLHNLGNRLSTHTLRKTNHTRILKNRIIKTNHKKKCKRGVMHFSIRVLLNLRIYQMVLPYIHSPFLFLYSVRLTITVFPDTISSALSFPSTIHRGYKSAERTLRLICPSRCVESPVIYSRSLMTAF